MTGYPDEVGAHPAVEALLHRLQDVVRRAAHTETVLRMVADWANHSTTIYDPIADRYCIQLPGDVVRTIAALEQTPESCN